MRPTPRSAARKETTKMDSATTKTKGGADGFSRTTEFPCWVCGKDTEPEGGFCEECYRPVCENHMIHAHDYGFCSNECVSEWEAQALDYE